MPTDSVTFSTGFEAGNLGAYRAVKTDFSSSITYTPGYSLVLQQANSWAAYKIGPTLESYASVAFRISRTGSNAKYRATIMEVVSESRLSDSDILPSGDFIGSSWFINSNNTLGGAVTCFYGTSGRTNFGDGDLTIINSAIGERASSIWMDNPIAEDRWYWLDTHTTVALTIVDGDEILDMSIEGYLNGEYLGSTDIEAINPYILTYCRSQGYDWRLMYTVFQSSNNNIMYLDNHAGHTDWPGEGVSNG